MGWALRGAIPVASLLVSSNMVGPFGCIVASAFMWAGASLGRRWGHRRAGCERKEQEVTAAESVSVLTSSAIAPIDLVRNCAGRSASAPGQKSL
jgi:hypothetical protein